MNDLRSEGTAPWTADRRGRLPVGQASTQSQALSAVLFLYKEVLAIDVGAVPPVVRARTPERLPVVLSRDEAGALLKDGYDIRTVQELLGHRDVRTTMIYLHVMQRGALGVTSPMDRL